MDKRILFVFLWAAILLGQTPTATVVGVVRDSSGAVVVGARVTARDEGTNIAHEAVTGDEGGYTIPLLTPGVYSVSAEAPNFRRTVQRGITLQVDQKARIDLALELGQVTDLIEVTADAVLTETESASVGTVIDNQKVVDLPLNGRQFYSLAFLAPGTFPPVQNSTNGFRGGFNVAGSSEISNNFTLDGITDNNGSINGPSFRPSIDAIGEFKLLTGVYPAEYGHNSGGQVVVTTKSGSNSLHGTAFDFLRNQVMDAKNYFTPAGPLPAFRRNQFGATLGGPVVHDKTFLFLSYEGFRLSQQVTALATVPTADMLAGNFSSLAALANPVLIRDPATGQPFAGNLIPASRLNAVGRALAGYYPSPTNATPIGQAPTNNYTFDEARLENLDQATVRLDHTFSARDSLYSTLNYFNDPSFEPSNSLCSSRVLPGFGCHVGLTTQLYGLVENHVFAPNLINEARIGYDRLRQPRIQQDSGINFDSQFGITAFYGSVPDNGGLPATSVTSYSALGGATNLPQDRQDNTYQFVDTVIWNRGRHSVKFGVDITRFGSNYQFVSSSRGSFNFTNTSGGPTSGYGLADLLLGLPASTSRNPYAPKAYPRTTAAAVYAQDDFKLTNNLTLNYGLRWELNTPANDKYGINSSLNPATGQLVYPGLNGYPHNLYQTDWNDFGPRLGLAWRPLHDDKTVIRAGAGIFYNAQATNNGLSNMLANPPFRQPQTFTSSVASPISLSSPFPTANGALTNTLTAINRDFRTATVSQWSFGVQRQITANLALDVSYFGSKGTHLPINYNINQPAPGPGTAAQVNARRPYPAWGNIGWIESVANSDYDSLQAKLEKRYSHGISFLTSYTFGRSIDDSPGISTSSAASSSTTQNSQNLRGSRGLSDFDVRHRFVFSPVYDLPFGKGRPFLSQGLLSKALGGFQVSGILALQTGNPLTASYSGNISNTYNNTDRPNAIGDPNTGPQTVTQWFNTAAFAKPAANSFGNEGRNVIQGPGLKNLDFTLARRFQVGERLTIRFRAELFNSLNHPNFNFPSATADSSSFGAIPSALDPRQVQLALKAIF